MPSSQDRFGAYHALTADRERAQTPEHDQVQALERAYRQCFPQEKFGEVSIGAADVAGFVEPFEQALEAGYQAGNTTKGDQFLTSGAQRGLDTIYVVKAPEGSALAKKESKAWTHHQSESLQRHIQNLQMLREQLKSHFTDMNPLFRNAYRANIEYQLHFCRHALEIGTPEYTVGQKSPDQWAKLIDGEATAQRGDIVLRLEDAARQALKTPQGEYLFRTVDDAVAFWRFSESEKRAITGDEPLQQESLTPTQGMRLFEVLLKRLDLTDWSVVKIRGSKALNVNSASRTVEFPETRTLTPDDMVLMPPHELGVHAVSGENGSQQPCPLLATGMPEYLATQEGLATIAEMIAGEPFGHPRQRVFAARYLAAAMAAKTVEENGVRRPKHTLQEIYNTLRSYQIDEKYASQTIWRIVRGTSLTRQIVSLPLPNGASVPAAETFVKDVVYFEGFMKLREFFMQTVPLLPREIDAGDRASIHGKQPEDFSSRLLARAGRAIAMEQTGPIQTPVSFDVMRRVYDAYVSLGRDALMNILQHFLVGKLRFEDMASPDSPWRMVLKQYPAEGMKRFSDLFVPKKS